MRTLILMRHGEASQKAAGGRDHARGLSKRGRAEVAVAGRQLAAQMPPPTFALCSSARRAVATFEGVLAALPQSLEVATSQDLYLCDGDELLAAIHDVDDGHASLLVVGHNPGIGWLAHGLARPEPGGDDAVQRLSRSFPTGCFAALEFATDRWCDVAPRTGAVRQLALPGERPARR